jgi:hypothetical protein
MGRFLDGKEYVSGTRRVPVVVAINLEATAHGVCRILFRA